jgi:LacI family transcriptional regulator
VKNKESARMGVEHLLGHGHRRIACLGVFRHTYTIKNRIQGYLGAMAEAGLEPDLTIMEPGKNQARMYLETWLKRPDPPTAIFSLNELTSVELLHALGTLKVSMPDTMALLGFDDVQLGELLPCPLTAIRQPSDELGTQAANLLVERMSEASESKPRRVVLETELILRKSCGCGAGL